MKRIYAMSSKQAILSQLGLKPHINMVKWFMLMQGFSSNIHLHDLYVLHDVYERMLDLRLAPLEWIYMKYPLISHLGESILDS